MAAFGLAPISLANALFMPTAAHARETEFRIDIPAGEIMENLSRLSSATGISIGLSGSLPFVRTHAVHGTMTVQAALKRLLSQTGWKAVQVEPMAYRIERSSRRPAPIRPKGIPTAPSAIAEAMPDITVTAQKREQSLDAVPFSLSVIELEKGVLGVSAPTTQDIALSAEGLALTNLGPGRNRQFIRGVADSPFNGASQSTVAVQLDDARVTFDAPNPDLRLIDVARVEILKGPQGPLYGSGALGGIYHIVTRHPGTDGFELTARLSSEAVQHGGIGGGVEGVVNLPLVSEQLALRAAGYAFENAGWIDNVGHKDNANTAQTYGGRAALRWIPADDWTVDLSGVFQNLNVSDSQYVTAERTVRREHAFPEPIDNNFRMLSGSVRGRLGELNFLSSTSYIKHTVNYLLDATDAAWDFGLNGPALFHDDRDYAIFNQELRVSAPENSRWIAGVAFMQARSRDDGMMSGVSGTPVPVELLDRKTTEFAGFGELSLPLSAHFDMALGARLSQTITEDGSTQPGESKESRASRTAFTPSISLSWSPQKGKLIYFRYARALRAGGLALSEDGTSRAFESDKVGTYDVGARLISADRRVSADVSVYYTTWSDIQSDYLLPNGLVSTRNAGKGRIFGGEASIDLQLTGRLKIFGGVSAQRALLIRTADGIELDDRRLPIAPSVTGRGGFEHEVDIADWRGRAVVQANYLGRARLSFDTDLDREMGDYATVSSFVSMMHDHLTLAARIDNLLDAKGDTFAFGNPFSIQEGPQYTPLRPRTLTLSVEYAW